jgi:hypothetical protein
MPPTFLVFMGLVVWVLAAVAVFMLAGVFAIFAGGRPTAWRLVSAMVGTFPGIVAYQVVAVPLAVAIVLVGGLGARLIEAPNPTHTTSNPVVIALSVATLFLAMSIGAAAALMGFFRGWRAGWAFASGRDVMSVVKGDPLVRFVGLIRSRVGHRGEP